MVYVVIIVLIVLVLSLYNYFDSRDINQLTSGAHNSTLFRNRNQAYGAYEIRRTYNIVITVILLITVGAFALFMVANYTFKYFAGNAQGLSPATREISDTTILSLYAPPEESETTLPPSYSIQSSTGSGGTDAADQEEIAAATPEQSTPETQEQTSDVVTDQVKATETAPQKSNEKSKNIPKSSDKEINDLKSHTEDVMSDARKRKDERDRKKKEKEQQDAMRSSGVTQQGSKANEGSKPKVETAADYVLEGRTPFNNDNWWLRYPTYTCKYGGTVTVKIKVDGGGNVVYAEPQNTAGLDPCIVDNARNYAKKARFSASSKSIQEGTLTYKFKGQ